MPDQWSEKMKSGALTIVIASVLHASIVAASIIYVGNTLTRASGYPDAMVAVSAIQERNTAGVEPIDAIVQDPEKLGARFKGRAANSHIYGDVGAPLTLFLFMDYDCPFCKKVYPVAKSFVDGNRKQVNLVVQHFPLDIHPDAMSWAVASECVAAQKGNDGFYKFLDKLLVDGGAMHNSNAPMPGMDIDKYQKCLSSKTVATDIGLDIALGNEIGVSGTPAIVAFNSDKNQAVIQLGAASADQLNALLKKVEL